MSFLTQPFSASFLAFGVQRKIDTIKVNVVMNESTNDTLTITKQPVQQGASISDHAYKEPTVFSMTAHFQDNLITSLSKIYQSLLDLQSSRVPFTVLTPKRIYKSMLMSSLSMTTDKTTENILSVSISMQEIIIVNFTTVQVPRKNQKSVGKTGATQKAGPKSFLVNIKEGAAAAISGVSGALR